MLALAPLPHTHSVLSLFENSSDSLQATATSVTCNFKQFVRTLARFQTIHESDNELSSPEKKAECKEVCSV